MCVHRGLLLFNYPSNTPSPLKASEKRRTYREASPVDRIPKTIFPFIILIFKFSFIKHFIST